MKKRSLLSVGIATALLCACGSDTGSNSIVAQPVVPPKQAPAVSATPSVSTTTSTTNTDTTTPVPLTSTSSTSSTASSTSSTASGSTGYTPSYTPSVSVGGGTPSTTPSTTTSGGTSSPDPKDEPKKVEGKISDEVKVAELGSNASQEEKKVAEAIKLVFPNKEGGKAPTIASDGKLELPKSSTATENDTDTNEKVKIYTATSPANQNGDNQNSQETETAVYLIDPATEGFKYQTYGQVFSGENSVGFTSIGVPFYLKEDQQVTASYSGRAIGSYQGESVSSNMTATLNWGTEAKTLDLKINNSKVFKAPEDDRAVGQLQANEQLNFDAKLHWKADEKQGGRFEYLGNNNNDSVSANLYGAGGAEVGGLFKKTITGTENSSGSNIFEGAFGGTKNENATTK